MHLKEDQETELMSLSGCLKAADETKELLLKKDALFEIPSLLEIFLEGKKPCLVADENTMKAAGEKIIKILEDAKTVIAGKFVFPRTPVLKADYSNKKILSEWFASLPDFPSIVPLSIGSGTINDLVKCAAGELRFPYMCVPTAASVDGYTSNGAALVKDGFKQTIPCPAPLVLAADTNIISNAPSFLASSGFGDLAGKICAGTDWIIAEKAGEAGAPGAPPIDKISWNMVQNNLLKTLEASIDAVKGNQASSELLFSSLAKTGFSMQHYKNSRPVSGSEHSLSHVWEMDELSVNGIPVTHGHKVALGTLLITAFTEIFFSGSEAPFPEKSKKRNLLRSSPDERKAEVIKIFGESPALEEIINTSLLKLMDKKKAALVDEALRDCWKELRRKIFEKLLPYSELKNLLIKAENPVRPEAAGLTRKNAIHDLKKAQMIRNKYGILDLAWDMGYFEDVLYKIENSDTYLY